MLLQPDLTDLCILYALTPVHAGAGQALGTVDLPIQRERHTNWPQVQSSGIKGAFRDWFIRYYVNNGNKDAQDPDNQAKELANQVFGREENSEVTGHAGALSVTDARLLAFPVRSDISPFVWVTCPALLVRLKQDLDLCGSSLCIPDITPSVDHMAIDITGITDKGSSIILEDMVVTIENHTDVAKMKSTFTSLAPQVKRLLVVSDNYLSFLVETATEVQPQIRIDMDTGATTSGSLRYQELLPADSVLYVLLFFNQERKKDSPAAAVTLKGHVKTAIASHVQIGGDMTLGRGIMAVNWLIKTSN
jgi:CRISPR-associated protein Cmr4